MGHFIAQPHCWQSLNFSAQALRVLGDGATGTVLETILNHQARHRRKSRKVNPGNDLQQRSQKFHQSRYALDAVHLLKNAAPPPNHERTWKTIKQNMGPKSDPGIDMQQNQIVPSDHIELPCSVAHTREIVGMEPSSSTRKLNWGQGEVYPMSQGPTDMQKT